MYTTLFTYLSKRFLQSFFIVLCTIFFVIISIDSIELVKHSHHVISITHLLTITLSKLPFIVQETFVFVIFFASVHSFFFLAKHNEYTALRASGVSIWQFLIPPVLIGVSISIVLITLLNPFSTILLNYSEDLKLKSQGKTPGNSISLLGGEIWLFDKDNDKAESYIINAVRLKADQSGAELTNPNFIFMDKDYKFVRIINTEKAELVGGNWTFKGYTEYVPKEDPKVYKETEYTIKNNLDLVNLQDNFKPPRFISIWDMPYIISIMKTTGYPTHQYYSYMYKLLIKPFLVPSIIFFAAAFALKSTRHYKVGVLIAIGLLAFVFLYCLTELILSISFDNHMLQMLNVCVIAIALNFAGYFGVRYFENG